MAGARYFAALETDNVSGGTNKRFTFWLKKKKSKLVKALNRPS